MLQFLLLFCACASPHLCDAKGDDQSVNGRGVNQVLVDNPPDVSREECKQLTTTFADAGWEDVTSSEAWTTIADGLLAKDDWVQSYCLKRIRSHVKVNRSKDKNFVLSDDVDKEVYEQMSKNLRKVLLDGPGQGVGVRARELAADALLLLEYSKETEKALRKAQKEIWVPRIKEKIKVGLEEYRAGK